MMTKDQKEELKRLQALQRKEERAMRARDLRAFRKRCMELWGMSPDDITRIVQRERELQDFLPDGMDGMDRMYGTL